MSDWKSNPHLFCNGEFRVQTTDGTVAVLDGIEYNGLYLHVKNSDFEDGEEMWHKSEATLIARPISDMSDEELIKFRGANVSSIEPDEREKLILQSKRKVNPEFKVSSFDILHVEDFIYLLSIGVYPFDQSHFGDSVINANQIEEE